MTPEELAIARIMYRLKIHEAKGQAFEDLFIKIYQLAHPAFVPIKPQGKIGDRKNDGYDNTNGTYYQVYAPEDLSANAAEAVKKLKKDFEGLKKYWDTVTPVKSYYFVMNDRFLGSFPTIETDLSEIKRKYNLQNCGSKIAKHLEDTLFGLSDDKIFSVIGFIPAPDNISTLDYSVLNSVVRHIIEYTRTEGAPEILSAPDFAEKIKVNDLSPRVSSLLWSAGNQIGIFENYFEKNSNFSKQQIKNHLNRIYQGAKQREYPPIQEGLTNSDYVFMEVLKISVPAQTQEYVNATLVVMAAFFESCDIFEEPGQKELL